MRGLQQQLMALSVSIFTKTRITALSYENGQVTHVIDSNGKTLAVSAVIDASGNGISATLLGQPMVAAVQWPAHRSQLMLPQLTLGKAARIRALHIAQQITGQNAAIALTPLVANRWQLSLDVAPGTSVAQAAEQAVLIAEALGGSVETQATSLAERDTGRPPAQINLAQLFSTSERGVCWAAWPQELHHANGTTWSWPARDRYGIPHAAVQLVHGPTNVWMIGKGMPVDAEAASALRVTGTCLALGGAVARIAATTLQAQSQAESF
jgi:hypothetical protein